MGLSGEVESIKLQMPYGVIVRRPATVDPKNTFTNIFTVSGLVIVNLLIGVRTIVQAGGASTMQFRHSVGSTVLDYGGLSIAADAVGTVYVLQGDLATNINIVSGAAGAAAPLANGSLGCSLIINGGTIQVNMTAAAGTGSTSYILSYTQLSEGAVVTLS